MAGLWVCDEDWDEDPEPWEEVEVINPENLPVNQEGEDDIGWEEDDELEVF